MSKTASFDTAEPNVDEIDALRREARQLLASIGRHLSPLKELHIRHRAGFLTVLADRMERDRAVVIMNQPNLTDVVAAPATAEVLDLMPRLRAAQKRCSVNLAVTHAGY